MYTYCASAGCAVVHSAGMAIRPVRKRRYSADVITTSPDPPLVVQTSDESLDRYQVHTRGGEKFPLENGVGGEVFRAIRLLHPEIPLRPEVPSSAARNSASSGSRPTDEPGGLRPRMS